MASLDDEDDRLRVLYFGDYGTGKTTSMAYMAKLGLVKWIRADKGIRNKPLKALGIPTDRIDPIDQLDPISMEKTIEEWREMLDDDPAALAGIAIDTATEWVARRIEKYVDFDWQRAVTQSERNHVELNPLERYTTGDGRDQYKGVTQEMRRLMRSLVELPCHVAVACQMTLEVDEGSGAVKRTPAVNPALRGDLIGYSNMVIRLQQEGSWPDGRPVVVGYPRPSAQFTGKDNFGVLPARLAVPTFDRLLAYVSGDLTKDTDPIQTEYRELLKVRKKGDAE
ncbi:MAG TPA: AAA family ATPase [Trebonia sp.]|nr:AAA family ATPase [Trebonia sp.]